ncbi:MAG: acetyl-CoA C-acyltransferase [Chitinophagales bacterium]|nr:acetyl-CoA C-acyltransferase [Chitinophagales bacterium]
MKEAFIIDAVRTPIGKYGGSLCNVRPDDLAAIVIKAIIDRNPELDVKEIEDVIFGAANQAGEDNRNVARMALLIAGLPIEIGGVTVNRLCASGLQAIMDAARALKCGDGNAYIAGGVESMSRAPFVMAKAASAFSRVPEMYDTTIGWRFTNPKLAEMYAPVSMGETAENVAEKWKISREEQDRFSHETQLKYQKAHDENRFADEIVSVTVPVRKGDPIIVNKDEHPRLSSEEKLNSLRPAFKQGGTVTAGNASGINDGAAALLLVNEEFLSKYEVKPMAKVRSMAIAGVDPFCMGIGPVPATRKALKRAGIDIADLGLVELNEAFAAQSVACMNELDLNPEIVNVNGGSIALGHPLGCSGARISTTLLHEMKKRDVQFGLATMCIGVGQGAAVIFEKV